jgi:hypothetical protein
MDRLINLIAKAATVVYALAASAASILAIVTLTTILLRHL